MAASKVKAHARKCKQGNAQVYKCYSYRGKKQIVLCSLVVVKIQSNLQM